MADHTNQNIISQVLIGNTTYEIHDKAAIHDIEDLGLGGNPLVFKGTVATRAALDDVASPVAGWVYLVTEDQSEWVYDGTEWELMDSAMVGEHTHDVVVPTKAETVDASKVVSTGEVVAGSDVVFTAGSHTADSFSQGEDKLTFDPGSYTAPSLTDTYVAPSFTPGEDVFTPNVPTTIDTTKFSGGSFTQGTDAFDAGSVTFTQGEDTFTQGDVTIHYTAQELNCTPCEFDQGTDLFEANTPTVIDTSKFSAGSASLTEGSYTKQTLNYVAPSFTQGEHTKIDVSKFNAGSTSLTEGSATLTGAVNPSWVATVDGETLSFTFNEGSHGTVSYTDPKLNYTAPSLETGFYTPGTNDTFNAGSASITDGSVVFPALDYTAPSLGAGFYKPGTAATFTQGNDSFTAGSCDITAGSVTATYTKPTFVQGQDILGYTAPSFTQGKDSFTAAKLNAGFYTAGKAASFVQGEDTFNAGSHDIVFNAGSYTAPSASFKQGTDTFTPGTYVAPTLEGGKATVVALPTFSTVSNLWSGNGSVTVTSGNPEAAE